MKINFIVLALVLSWASPLLAQNRQPEDLPKGGVSCEEQRHALASGAYVDAALEHIWPEFPASRGITIAVGFRHEVKVFLHTDGVKFELWKGSANVPGNNIVEFLSTVADSCALPPDPAAAVKLLKIRWEVKELQRAQFDQLHGDFLTAATEYLSTVRERSSYFMATTMSGFAVDASNYPIVYDNSWEHFKIVEWNLPINGHTSPMVRWVHEFQTVAEQTFHGSLDQKEQSSAY